MNGASLQNKESFNLVGVAFEHDLSWHGHITLIATSAAKKLVFLFRARKYFSSSNLYTLYVSQIRPCLKYCSYVWRAAPPSTLGILDSIQRKAIRLIDDPVLTERLSSLAHRRAELTFLSSTDISIACARKSWLLLFPHCRVTRGALHSTQGLIWDK